MTREEAIARIQRALDVPNRFGLAWVDDETLEVAISALKTERLGEWIKPTLEYDKRRCDVICPFCHHGFLGRPNYCSHCGAKMKGGAE